MGNGQAGAQPDTSEAGEKLSGQKMIGVVVFNFVMLGLCAVVGSGLVPANPMRLALDWMHNTIGITSPPEEKVRMVALLWLGSIIVIVDGVLFMLVFFTSLLM
jgi:hypothetical protein